jgi:hypothetical protein
MRISLTVPEIRASPAEIVSEGFLLHWSARGYSGKRRPQVLRPGCSRWRRLMARPVGGKVPTNRSTPIRPPAMGCWYSARVQCSAMFTSARSLPCRALMVECCGSTTHTRQSSARPRSPARWWRLATRMATCSLSGPRAQLKWKSSPPSREDILASIGWSSAARRRAAGTWRRRSARCFHG